MPTMRIFKRIKKCVSTQFTNFFLHSFSSNLLFDPMHMKLCIEEEKKSEKIDENHVHAMKFHKHLRFSSFLNSLFFDF